MTAASAASPEASAAAAAPAPPLLLLLVSHLEFVLCLVFLQQHRLQHLVHLGGEGEEGQGGGGSQRDRQRGKKPRRAGVSHSSVPGLIAVIGRCPQPNPPQLWPEEATVADVGLLCTRSFLGPRSWAIAVLAAPAFSRLQGPTASQDTHCLPKRAKTECSAPKLSSIMAGYCCNEC